MSTTTVMVVEDDAALLARFCSIVAQSPELSLLAAAGDLASARQALHGGAPDVLLTDLGLPGVSGGELARSAATVRPGMEVVYVSGIPQDIAVKKGLIKAGSPFIAKPFTTDVLAGMLRSVLARHSNLPAP